MLLQAESEKMTGSCLAGARRREGRRAVNN